MLQNPQGKMHLKSANPKITFVMKHPLKESVGNALRRRIPMALYAFPGIDEHYCFFEAATVGTLNDEEHDFGFFYAPFINKGEAPRIIIPCDNTDSMSVDSVGDIRFPVSTEFGLYKEHVSAIAAHHMAQSGGKTVYARRISDPEAVVDWPSMAFDYFSAFPDTFRFMFATPDAGCWLGASPELLIRRDAGSSLLTTMALAGTLRDNTSEWDEKNIEEHDYVTRFILDVFASLGIKAHVSGAEDVRFGSIRHLCHRITAHYSGPIIPLLNALSPTPALSGSPRAEAIDMISLLEGHRSLYGGYVGVNSPSGIRAFVNLRSMNFNHKGGYCLYAGGGITSLSQPSDEWLETEAKSAVLRRCISAHTINPSSAYPNPVYETPS